LSILHGNYAELLSLMRKPGILIGSAGGRLVGPEI
jgi:hypothetical protein